MKTTFYRDLPVKDAFDTLTSDEEYTPLPDDWLVGSADIVSSTDLIAEGKYKTVNTVGAAVISAQLNAAEHNAFPYSFGGDGAAFAIPPEQEEKAREALGRVRRWAKTEFDIELRGAMVSVADIRAAGFDVRVARFRVSNGADYAMFAGGGISWAEARMKKGEHEVPMAAAGELADLTGLSCRWTPMESQNGRILSLVVAPSAGATRKSFANTLREVLQAISELDNNGTPVPPEGPGFRWIPEGLELEARATHGASSVLKRRIQLLFETFIALVFFKTGWKAGEFDPVHYTRTCGDNADFRKFEDGLKMTVDADDTTLARIEGILDAAAAKDVLRYGLHTQDDAIMTCIVPSITTDDHVHFIDGADGGYAMASARMKAAA